MQGLLAPESSECWFVGRHFRKWFPTLFPPSFVAHITTCCAFPTPAVSCASLPIQQARTHLQPSRSFLPTKPTTFRLHRTVAFHIVPSHSLSALVPSVA